MKKNINKINQLIVFMVPLAAMLFATSCQTNLQEPSQNSLSLQTSPVNNRPPTAEISLLPSHEETGSGNLEKVTTKQDVKTHDTGANSPLVAIADSGKASDMTPATDDQASDEISDSENLVLTSSDAALSAQSPTLSPLQPADGTTSTAFNGNNFLFCNDNLYYDSWVKQFNSQWLNQNAHSYSNFRARNKALAHARTNEFIKLAYPAIEKTGFDYPVVINPEVLEWIEYFKGPGHKNFVVWLRRSEALLPEMEKVFEKYALPKDLVYLSMIESGYSPKALSSAGAVGLWQFMPFTGREYGLKINDYIDERRNVTKSTEAAASFLSYLYSLFGSWHLATASYNAGPGILQKALRNYGEESSFFDLTSLGVVNKETSAYVPKLIAAMIISKNPDAFGFDLSNVSVPPPTQKIILKRSIAIADLARSLKMDTAVLESLNPDLRNGVTPPPQFTSDGFYNLQVPASKYSLALARIHSLPNAPTERLVSARTKRRESLASFAARYHVTTAALLRANSNLRARSRLHAGQEIYIPVSLGSGQYELLTARHYSAHHHRKHFKSYIVKRKHGHTYLVAVRSSNGNYHNRHTSNRISGKLVHKQPLSSYSYLDKKKLKVERKS